MKHIRTQALKRTREKETIFSHLLITKSRTADIAEINNKTNQTNRDPSLVTRDSKNVLCIKIPRIRPTAAKTSGLVVMIR